MNSSHFSKLAIVVVVLLAVAAAGPAAAIEDSASDVPADAEVNSSVDVTYTFEEPLYENYNEWTLVGETELESVTWTVTTAGPGDDEIAQESYTDQTFSHQIAKADDVIKVTVRLEGTVPEWEDWSYDPAQSLTLANFTETQNGGSENEIRTDEFRPYTEDSQAARDAIDDAQSAIEEADSAGVNVEEAESLRENAISAYDSGNFENAQDLAENAQNAAESAQQSSQRTSTLLLIGGVILVVAILAGLVYWYLSTRETYDKLG